VAIARVQGLIDVTVVDIKSGSVCRGRVIRMACGSVPALGESASPHGVAGLYCGSERHLAGWGAVPVVAASHGC
jgi:hypothetical protein